MRIAEQSRRFVSLDKPVDKFIEDQKNENTLSKTRKDVSLLSEFLNSKTESRRARKSCQKNLMNISVSEFIVAARRKDGEDSEPSSLRGLICSINQLCTGFSHSSVLYQNSHSLAALTRSISDTSPTRVKIPYARAFHEVISIS